MGRGLLIGLVVVAALVAGLALTAGGGDGGRAMPDVEVARLGGDGSVALREAAASDRPTLLWFWAPWCEVCNAEAQTIERFAAETRDELAVVAIGGRDRAPAGREFVERHGLRTPLVLFDEPMAAWEGYAIAGQPVGVLLDRDGRERGRWSGAFDTAEVREASRSL